MPSRSRAAVDPASTASQPTVKKSRALKIACENRCPAAASPPCPAEWATASGLSMTATCEIVDQARMRLTSTCKKAVTAAYTIVAATAIARTHWAAGAACSKGASKVKTHVPAATMVAAWMSAEAGVGPSMASTSQSWNGICADLPMQWPSAVIASARAPWSGTHAPVSGQPRADGISLVPVIAMRATIPMTKAASASRVTRNALYAARRGAARWLQ